VNGCTICGGYGMKHDPIAHDAEPDWVMCPACNGDGTVRRGEFDWTCDDCAGDGGWES
jgi:DnaJ-class molecular chaperone